MPEKAGTFFRPCSFCESACGLVIKTDGSRVLSIAGDKQDPHSKGHICPKARALKYLHEDPDRLKTPVLKTGSGWKPIGWDEALDRSAALIRKIQKAHGKDSVALYFGNPNAYSHGFLLSILPFIFALGSRNRYSSTSVDQLPTMVAAYLVFGHQAMVPVPDLDRTSHFLVFGSNLLVSQGSMMSVGNMADRLSGLKARGGRLITVDPRRHKTARAADQHVFIRPGTDALLLLAMINTLFVEGLVKPGKLFPHMKGMEKLRLAAMGFPAKAVAPVTGVAEETIRQLAREFALAPAAACYGRMGICAQLFGGLTNWLVFALNLLTGNVDRPGGLMFARPVVDAVPLIAKVGASGSLNRYKSRVSGLPEFSGELPAAALYDEILTPGKGQVKGLVTIGTNMGLSSPDTRRVEKALSSLTGMISLDYYANETTRHATVILPISTPLEHEVFHLATEALMVRNKAKFGDAVFDCPENARHDWQIIFGLAARLKGIPAADFFAGLGHPSRLLDILIRTGPYGAGLNLRGKGLTLDKLRKSPHGIDLGPLVPCLPERLYAPDKKIDLAPQPCLDDLDRLKEHFFGRDSAQKPGELQLVGRRTHKSMNWWLHNYPKLMVNNPFEALMHPEDAKERGISDGDMVRVSSDCGQFEVQAGLTHDIMPSVISIPHGWGHNRPGARLSVAGQHAGACINEVTSLLAVDKMCGMAALNGQWVKVGKAG
ncbi:MAG: molybdopterin-dependent oxidoreductase [Desulfatibacillaceae bacterium]|nr:molybdopterin-dependent oxidoreductase [Desulfatibacillaceae bacterium]